jgi:hypothetical protein
LAASVPVTVTLLPTGISATRATFTSRASPLPAAFSLAAAG